MSESSKRGKVLPVSLDLIAFARSWPESAYRAFPIPQECGVILSRKPTGVFPVQDAITLL